MNEQPAPAPAPPPAVPIPPTASGAISFGIHATGRTVTIPEHAALILIQLLDRITLGGSDLKFSVALAQRALEEAMRTMQAQAAAEAANPPSRQQRRAAARKAKAG